MQGSSRGIRRSAEHKRDVRAEAGEELAELDSYRFAADHEDAAGDFPQRGGLTVCPHRHVLCALDGRDARVRPGRDDDMLGGQDPPVDVYLALPARRP